MNEMIKKMLIKSQLLEAIGENAYEEDEWEPIIEKFAELIAWECASIVENKIEVSRYVHEAELLRECSATIKQHFGVEE